MTMLLMLCVLGMLIAHARDPGTWRWVSGDAAAADQGEPAQSEGKQKPKAPEPAPEQVFDGPTDEDPYEVEAIEGEFEAVSDGDLRIAIEDMLGAYPRLVCWSKNQSFAAMCKRAWTGLSLGDFNRHPDQYRGKLVNLDLDVKRVRKCSDRDVLRLLKDEAQGVSLYEIWGSPRGSKNRLVEAVVVGLPAGLPVGPKVERRATLVGYFFKVQGYEDGSGAYARAPLVIGRLALGYGATAVSAVVPSASPGPAAGKPAGEDHEEAAETAAAQEDFSRVVDGNDQEELPACRRLVRWVVDRPLEAMEQRARTDLLFNDLYSQPEDYRGTLVKLRLAVKRIEKANDQRARALLGDEAEGVELYEAWGPSFQSKSHLYKVLLVGLPEGMPTGLDLSEEATFVGYFFKVIAYNAASDGKMYRAPLLVGRLDWHPPEESNTELLLGGLALGAFLLVVAAGWWLLLARRHRRGVELPPVSIPLSGTSENVTVENWLEQAEAGRVAVDLGSGPQGNNFDDQPDSSIGDAMGNGRGDGLPTVFPGGLDDDQSVGR